MGPTKVVGGYYYLVCPLDTTHETARAECCLVVGAFPAYLLGASGRCFASSGAT